MNNEMGNSETRELTIDELDIVSGGSPVTELAHEAAQAAAKAAKAYSKDPWGLL
jgi:hypothetical protein